MLTSTRTLAPLLCLTLAGASPTQTQLVQLRKAVIPADTSNAQAIAIGDVNADSVPDLVLGQRGGPTLLCLGQGQGHFVLGTLPATTADTRAVALLDADGDGDLDLWLGNAPLAGTSGQDQLLRNDGQGGFLDVTAAQLPAERESTQAIAIGDVDGDGDLDVVLGNGADATGHNEQDRLLVNDGRGTFADATATALPQSESYTSSLALGDLDGDRDLDLVVAHGSFAFGWPERDRLYFNDGRGVFRADAQRQLPDDAAATPALTLADVDLDGDLDLAAIDASVAQSGAGRLLVNDGTGAFTTSTAWATGSLRARALGAADVDADGHLDLVAGGYGEPCRLWLGQAQGGFAPGRVLRDEAPLTQALALQDLDNDVLPELLLLDAAGAELWINQGFGLLFDAMAPMRPPASGLEVVASCRLDADGDGDADLVLARAAIGGGQRLELWRNDGHGGLAGATLALPGGAATLRALAAGDVDGDDDQDLVLGTSGAELLLVNDGTGAFGDGSSQLPATGGDTPALALGDLDGDQDQDLVLADLQPGGTIVRVWHNDGAGSFTAAATVISPHDARALLLADLDGDLDLDAVLGTGSGTFGQPDQLLRNDGTGVLAIDAQALPDDRDPATALAAADLDGDGDQDLVVANGVQGTPLGAPVRLYRNDGQGRFSAAPAGTLVPTPTDRASVSAGDLDEDGLPDLLLGGFDATLRYYQGQAGSTWSDVSATRVPAAIESRWLHAQDLDGDGDQDLLCGQTRCWLLANLHRQAHTPLCARAGFPWTLELWSQPGYGQGTHGAVAALSLGPLLPPLDLPPYGTLRLDPATMILIPGLLVPPGTPATLTFTIPSLLPPLAGQRLWAQGLTMPGAQAAGWRLTNATADLVLK